MFDLASYCSRSGIRCSLIHEWEHEGHSVVVVRTKPTKQSSLMAENLMLCDCDVRRLDHSSVVAGKIGEDPNVCPARKAVRAAYLEELKSQHAGRWSEMGLKAAIKEVYLRHVEGEYLGNTVAALLYRQDVAELLGVTMRELHEPMLALYGEGVFDFSGNILVPYKETFRFPIEIQNLLRYLIEEPLGWPNGDAGDGFLWTIQGAITEAGSFTSGREVFGPADCWPGIRPDLLLRFGLQWAVGGAAALAPEDRLRAAQQLEALAQELRSSVGDS